MVIRASGLEEAVELAKVCQVLQQGGTVEVKEVQPRPAAPGQKQEQLQGKDRHDLPRCASPMSLSEDNKSFSIREKDVG